MTSILKKYLKKRIRSKFEFEVLENSVQRFSLKKGLLFSNFNYHPFIRDEWTNPIECKLEESFPVSPSDFDWATEKGKVGKHGYYIHMVNTVYMCTENIISSVHELKQTSGDVCFSDFGDNLFYGNAGESHWGIVVEGTPKKSFPYDCHSYKTSEGHRFATVGYRENSSRSEHWIDISLCSIIGLVYTAQNKKCVQEAGDFLGLLTINKKDC